jgi:hypothetical protein
MVPQSQAIVELLENTEDAYGFPPYRYLAQALSVGGLSYDELRERERLILVSAMESVQVQRLGSDDFTWAEKISAAIAPVTVKSDVPYLDVTEADAAGREYFEIDESVPERDPLSGSEA